MRGSMSDKSSGNPSRRSGTEELPRNADRKQLGVEVVFQPTGQAPQVGTVVDLSPGGACIATSRHSAVGEAMLLYLPYPSRDEPTGVTATVRWSEPGRFGVQFTLSEGAHAESVNRLLENPLFAKRTERPGPPATGFTRDDLLAVERTLLTMARRVRFQEVDAAGTIYYSRVLEYFGDVYVELLERSGLGLPKILSERQWFAPLVHAEVDYLAPMRFGDNVVVAVTKGRAGSSAITVGYRITTEDKKPLAVGHTVHVFVDGATFRPCAVPEEVRKAFAGQADSSGDSRLP